MDILVLGQSNAVCAMRASTPLKTSLSNRRIAWPHRRNPTEIPVPQIIQIAHQLKRYTRPAAHIALIFYLDKPAVKSVIAKQPTATFSLCDGAVPASDGAAVGLGAVWRLKGPGFESLRRRRSHFGQSPECCLVTEGYRVQIPALAPFSFRAEPWRSRLGCCVATERFRVRIPALTLRPSRWLSSLMPSEPKKPPTYMMSGKTATDVFGAWR